MEAAVVSASSKASNRAELLSLQPLRRQRRSLFGSTSLSSRVTPPSWKSSAPMGSGGGNSAGPGSTSPPCVVISVRQPQQTPCARMTLEETAGSPRRRGGEVSLSTRSDGLLSQQRQQLPQQQPPKFVARLSLAWNLLFAWPTERSAADLAKKRLQRVLRNDRLEACPQLKQELCSNIVSSMAEYVVVNPKEEVKFKVHREPDSGLVYTVAVPVARVKPPFQP